MKKENLTYTDSGVNYELMDPFKRVATLLARETAGNLGRHGATEVGMSRGESAYLVDIGDRYLAHVEEGLGTKNLVADAMYKLTGKSYYEVLAQDTPLFQRGEFFYGSNP